MRTCPDFKKIAPLTSWENAGLSTYLVGSQREYRFLVDIARAWCNNKDIFAKLNLDGTVAVNVEESCKPYAQQVLLNVTGHLAPSVTTAARGIMAPPTGRPQMFYKFYESTGSRKQPGRQRKSLNPQQHGRNTHEATVKIGNRVFAMNL